MVAIFQSISASMVRVLTVVILTMVIGFMATSERAVAQAQFWIQVESQQTIRDTRDRAQFFASKFPETHAFQTTSGWYAIVIGPYSRAEAADLMDGLKLDGRIPGDSLVSNGQTHRGQLWPLAASTETTATTAATGTTDTETTTTGTVVIEEPDTDQTNTTASVTVSEPTDSGVNAATDTGTTTVAVTETNTGSADAGATDSGTDQGQDVSIAQPADAVEPEPTGPIPDPDLKATRALERGWSRDEKKEYQTYMVWTGDYESAIDGSYGRGTRAAIRGFQAREGFEDTGYLTEQQVALLKQRYDASVAKLGIEPLRSLDAGIEMLFPAALVDFGRFEPPFVHYTAKSSERVQMMLISQEGGRATLRSLYDIMETFEDIPPEGYRVRKRDWFVLSGRNDDVVSYTYARISNNQIKGFTMVWEPKLDNIMQPLVTAMYNSFQPLDDYVLDETLGYGQGDDEPVDLTTGIDTAEPAHAASGFFVSAAGVLVTHVDNVEACTRLTIADGVELDVLARNRKLELAVLKPRGDFTPRSFALFSNEPIEVGIEITVAGFSFPDVMEVATLNYGTLTAINGMLDDQAKFRMSAFLESGDAGGPVLDDRGAVLGMQLVRGADTVNLPEYVNFAIKSGQIMDLLDRHALVYGQSSSFDPVDGEDLAYMAGDFTAKISCWK